MYNAGVGVIAFAVFFTTFRIYLVLQLLQFGYLLKLNYWIENKVNVDILCTCMKLSIGSTAFSITCTIKTIAIHNTDFTFWLLFGNIRLMLGIQYVSISLTFALLSNLHHLTFVMISVLSCKFVMLSSIQRHVNKDCDEEVKYVYFSIPVYVINIFRHIRNQII